MKRTIILCFFALLRITATYAQTSQFEHIDSRVVLRLQEGTCQKRDDGTFIFIPIPPSNPGVPKSPGNIIAIGVTVNTIFTYGQLGGYTLYIIRADEVLYKTRISNGEEEISLPVELVGECLLFFVDEEKGACFFGEVRNGTFANINPDILAPQTISTTYVIDWDTMLFNHTNITDGGTLVIKNMVACHANVIITIEGSGRLIIDGGTLSNAHIILKDNAFLGIYNGGVLVLNKDYNFSMPIGTTLDIRLNGSMNKR